MCDVLISLLLLLSCSVMSSSLWTHELQHAKLPCPSLSPGVCSNWCPLSRWCHPTISSSVALFSSSCLQSFPASENFPWVSSGFKEIIGSFSLRTIFLAFFFFLLHLSKCNYVPGLGRTQMVKNLQKIWGQPLGQEDPLEEEMATHTSVLAWRIPWTEEPRQL